MATKITNDELFKRLTEVNKSLRSELGAVSTIVLSLQDDMRDLKEDVKIFNDYMIGQKAIDDYKNKSRSNGTGTTMNLNKEFVNVVIKFLGVVTTILGILYFTIKELVR